MSARTSGPRATLAVLLVFFFAIAIAVARVRDSSHALRLAQVDACVRNVQLRTSLPEIARMRFHDCLIDRYGWTAPAAAAELGLLTIANAAAWDSTCGMLADARCLLLYPTLPVPRYLGEPLPTSPDSPSVIERLLR